MARDTAFTERMQKKSHRKNRKKIEAGIYTDNRNLTPDQYFAEWLTGKRIGGRKVQQIERREILNLQRDISDGLRSG